MTAHRIDNGYVTLEVLRAALGRGAGVWLDDDARLARMAYHASREVDSYCGRHFYPAVQTRQISARSSLEVRLSDMDDADLLSVTTLTTDTTGNRTYPLTWTAGTDYELLPIDAPDQSPPEPYTKVVVSPTGAKRFPLYPQGVKIQGEWGYYKVPRRSQTTLPQAGVNGTATAVPIVDPTLDPIGVGHILLLGTEQMLVTEMTPVSGDSDIATVVRAYNGTTAAVHAGLAVIDILTFPVVEAATLIIAERAALRQNTPFGSQSAEPFGEQVVSEAMDPEAAAWLDRFAHKNRDKRLPVRVGR